jgi:NAD(P)-dependent dehydrogenase (short-subunit alcohol dehydrogenase family)
METVSRIVVVGGTGYLGAAVCRHLRQAGHSVAFTYHRKEGVATALSAELNAPCCALDLTDHSAIGGRLQALAGELGGIDALVVAAGLATAHEKDGVPVVPVWDAIEPAAFARMLAVNVMGAFFACQWAGSAMRVSKAGRIVLVGSIDGVKSVPSPVDYACCKAALVGMVQSLSKDLGPHGVVVNLVAPGILDGGIAGLLSRDLHDEYVKHCTLKRVGRPDEIAKWVAFLAGAKNTYLTGQTVILDGGL